MTSKTKGRTSGSLHDVSPVPGIRTEDYRNFYLYLRAVPRLRMSGATPPISLYAFLACAGFNLALKTAKCRSEVSTSFVCAYKNRGKTVINGIETYVESIACQ